MALDQVAAFVDLFSWGPTGMLATTAVSAFFDFDAAVLSAVRQIGTTGPAAAVRSVAASCFWRALRDGLHLPPF